MKALEDAPQPADADKARLLQMRNMAREFQGSMKDGEDVTELRLLPQPIYRLRLSPSTYGPNSLILASRISTWPPPRLSS